MTTLKVTEIVQKDKSKLDGDDQKSSKVKMSPTSGDTDIKKLTLKEEGESDYSKGDKIELNRTSKQSDLSDR